MNFVTMSMLEEWEYSAQNLISHFRCVLRGSVPFGGEAPLVELAAKAGLDAQAVEYMERITNLLELENMSLSIVLFLIC